MSLTNEKIEQILADAPEGAVDFINGDYNDKDGRVYDHFEGRFAEEDYPSFGMPLETYREILQLRQQVERLELERGEIEAQLKEREWISVDERLPEIDYSGPEYSHYIDVICREGKKVRQLRYISNAYAKTEKGREPRFEELSGKLAFMNPTDWMPLPKPPKDNKHE